MKSCHPALPPFLGPRSSSPVLGSDVGHDVLIEELQDQRDAVGEDQVLGHVFKLKPTEETKHASWDRILFSPETKALAGEPHIRMPMQSSRGLTSQALVSWARGAAGPEALAQRTSRRADPRVPGRHGST